MTHGRGFVQSRDGEKATLTAGDIVYAPPGEEHWHGAAEDSILVHLAISLGSTDWLKEVDEDLYRRVVADG